MANCDENIQLPPKPFQVLILLSIQLTIHKHQFITFFFKSMIEQGKRNKKIALH